MKTYGEFCAVAHALDVIGDRWALLVVRELTLGPRRYTDLLHGLPRIGTNVLSTRLRELETSGVIERRSLAPPNPARLYELSDDGRDLHHVLDALARWGSRRLTWPSRGEAVEPGWFVLSAAAAIDAEDFDNGVEIELNVDEETFVVSIERGGVLARRGSAVEAAAALHGTLPDFYAASRADASAVRRLKIGGDKTVGRKFISRIAT